MTIGDGIVAVSIASIIIIVLKTKFSKNGKNDCLSRSEHDKVCSLIQQGIQERFEVISKQLDSISKDVKFLVTGRE